MEFGHLEGVPQPLGELQSPWLLTTYIHWDPILQVPLSEITLESLGLVIIIGDGCFFGGGWPNKNLSQPLWDHKINLASA